MTKIVVAGGTGLTGAKVVAKLASAGHTVVPASRRTGVNLYTSDGLADVLEGAEVVVHAYTSPYTDYEGALDFFSTATLNILTHGAVMDVKHHVAVSFVGTDKLALAGGLYFQAKAEQERLIEESGTGYSFVHSTQYFEFVRSIADAATHAHVTQVAEALVQPISADDAASAIADTALSEPTHRADEIAGPDQFRLNDIVSLECRWSQDPREIQSDANALYLGTRIGANDLLPSPDATLYWTHFTDWLEGRAT